MTLHQQFYEHWCSSCYENCVIIHTHVFVDFAQHLKTKKKDNHKSGPQFTRVLYSRTFVIICKLCARKQTPNLVHYSLHILISSLDLCKIMREIELYSLWTNSRFKIKSVGLVHKDCLNDSQIGLTDSVLEFKPPIALFHNSSFWSQSLFSARQTVAGRELATCFHKLEVRTVM